MMWEYNEEDQRKIRIAWVRFWANIVIGYLSITIFCPMIFFPNVVIEGSQVTYLFIGYMIFTFGGFVFYPSVIGIFQLFYWINNGEIYSFDKLADMIEKNAISKKDDKND